MAALFLDFLNRGIAVGWLILAILLLRLVFRKAPKAMLCGLWAIAAIRLICPFSIESVWSLLPSSETISPEILSENTFTVNTGMKVVDSSVNEYLGDHYFEGVSVPTGNGNQIMNVFAVIWLTGIVLLLGYTLFSYLKLRRRVAESIEVEENIRFCDRIDTPFILGIFRPQIYLPSNLEKKQLTSVLAHEQAHLKRLDYFWKPLGFLLLTLYWFQPLVWLAYYLFCRDIELACDEKVICTMDLDQRKQYSSALLACSIRRQSFAACPLAFGEVSVKQRIRSVLSYKKPAFWLVVTAVIVCIAAAVGFLTNPKTSYENAKMESLYKWRTEYVGDNSAVGNIISQLEFPEGYTFEKFELPRSAPPYEITIWLKASQKTLQQLYQRDFENDVKIFKEDACILFSLIHNFTMVQFKIPEEDRSNYSTSLGFVRKEEENRLNTQFYANSTSIEAFDKLLSEIHEKIEQSEITKEEARLGNGIDNPFAQLSISDGKTAKEKRKVTLCEEEELERFLSELSVIQSQEKYRDSILDTNEVDKYSVIDLYRYNTDGRTKDLCYYFEMDGKHYIELPPHGVFETTAAFEEILKEWNLVD